MEVLSKFDSAESKPSKGESGSAEPVRPLHLPRAAVKPPEIAPPPRPPEMPSSEAVGVLLFSRQAQAAEQAQQAQVAKAAAESVKLSAEDDDDDEDEQKRPQAQAARPTDQPPVSAESAPDVPQAAAPEIPLLHSAPVEAGVAEAIESETVEQDTPLPFVHTQPLIPAPRQEVFVYPESSVEAAAPIPAAELPKAPVESYASEPLPPIAGENASYDEEPEEPPTAPTVSPLHASPVASTPVWNPGHAPRANNPNTPANVPPPPAHTGPGGGGPPMPPSVGPNGYPGPGGPGGPGNPNLPPSGFGPNPNAAPVPAATPNMAPGVNANVSLGLANNRVRAVDWPARLIGLAGFVSSRRTRRKLGKRIDKVESTNKRSQSDVLTRQRRFEREQRQHSTEINRLQTEQQRLAQEKQRMQAEALPPMPPVVNAEQQQHEEILKQQGLELQPNQHVEHSAWHSIVVNEHGKAVQNGMQYGEGFRREQQQEAIQDRTSAMAGARAALADGAALGAGAGLGGAQSMGSVDGSTSPQQQYAPVPPVQATSPAYPGSVPGDMTSQALPPGLPTHADAQHQLPAHTEDKRPVSGLAFWIMLVIIIAAFFIAALI